MVMSKRVEVWFALATCFLWVSLQFTTGVHKMVVIGMGLTSLLFFALIVWDYSSVIRVAEASKPHSFSKKEKATRLGIVALFALAVFFAGTTYYQASRPPPELDLEQIRANWRNAQLKRVPCSAPLINETIILDGHMYVKCVFVNPKFVFRGELPFLLVQPKVEGHMHVDIRDPRTDAVIAFFRGFHLISDTVNFIDDTVEKFIQR